MAYQILHLPSHLRPRERFKEVGALRLSDAELIAILLGSGISGRNALDLAQALLTAFGGIVGIQEASLEELCQLPGCGEVKAIQLKAALALASRLPSLRSPTPRIDSAERAYHHLRPMMEEWKEERLVALLLDTRGHLKSCETIAIGTLNEVLVHPREVFYPAIRQKASALLLAHNHPSGDPSPSVNDLDLTSRLLEAGAILEIPLCDHLIIGKGQYVSLAESWVDERFLMYGLGGGGSRR